MTELPIVPHDGTNFMSALDEPRDDLPPKRSRGTDDCDSHRQPVRPLAMPFQVRRVATDIEGRTYEHSKRAVTLAPRFVHRKVNDAGRSAGV
jgi:hypothetical protein